MTLTNYWWLIIWMFVGGYILDKFFPKTEELIFGKTEIRWKVLPAILLVVPLIIWAGFRDNTFGDTAAYRELFNAAPSSLALIPSYLESVTKDRGFSVLMVLFKWIFGNNCTLFFLILAIFQLCCVAMIFRKYSCNYWFSIFVFVASTEYLSWMHNGIRQFIAVALIFAATELFFEKKYFKLTIIILIASTIHGSALMMLPIMFIVQGQGWNRKTVLCVLFAIIALLYVNP